MMAIFICVSKNDIIDGISYHLNSCAIAKAFYREGFYEVSSTSKRIRFSSTKKNLRFSSDGHWEHHPV